MVVNVTARHISVLSPNDADGGGTYHPPIADGFGPYAERLTAIGRPAQNDPGNTPFRIAYDRPTILNVIDVSGWMNDHVNDSPIKIGRSTPDRYVPGGRS